MAEQKQLNIGVDYGGVCSISAENYEDSKKLINEEINMPGCREALKKLKSLGHKLVLVSFCGARRARQTREYLAPLGLFDELVFVKNRDHKTKICKFYGLDVMIDDRLDILETVAPTQAILFDYGSYTDKPFGVVPSTVKKDTKIYYSSSWPSTLDLLSTMQPLGLVPDKTFTIDNLCYV
jgi:hypothetical protein